MVTTSINSLFTGYSSCVITSKIACRANYITYTPFTRYRRLSNRLYNRFNNWLYRVNKELQTFRTQDLSFPRTKSPYGELSSPGNETFPGERKFQGLSFPGTFDPGERMSSIGTFRLGYEKSVIRCQTGLTTCLTTVLNEQTVCLTRLSNRLYNPV